MEQTLSQHYTFFFSTIYETFDRLMNDPMIGFVIFVILSSLWVVYQFKDYSRSKQQSKVTRSQVKCVEKVSKVASEIQSTVDQEAAQKERLLRQLELEAIKHRENPQKKSKLGSKEFFNKKSMIHSYSRRTQANLSNWNNAEKQDEENKRSVKEQGSKRMQNKPSPKLQTTLQERQQKRIPSFNTIPSNNSINLDVGSPTKKDAVIEKAQQPLKDMFSSKLAEMKKEQANENIAPPKNNQQDQNINKPMTNVNSLFGNSQPSLFASTFPKSTPQANKVIFPPINIAQPMPTPPITPPTDSLFKIANNNIQQANQQVAPILPNTIKIPQMPKQQQPSIAVPKPVQNKIPIISIPVRAQPSPAVRPKQKLNSEDLLQAYINFVQNLKEEVTIPTKVQSLMGGARSSPNVILIQAKSLLATIDKNDDKQITAFALKLFETIVFNFINNSNVKSGLERIPLRERTKQCEKNAINAYILTLNMYRLMNHGKKIWAIVFGKILKMMSFLFKRKQDLQNYHKLELIQCNYIKKFKEVQSKYVSRIDFLMYFLLGMTAFDPLLILRQVEVKERDVQTSRAEVQSWGNKWSYSEFWSLAHAVLKNKHQSYSKPIFFMNLLYVLYPRIVEHKMNPSLFKQENDLFLIIIGRAKSYLKGFDKMKEIKILSEIFENEQYEYDGADLVKSIQVLDSRFAEKEIEIKMNAKDFEAKANIFYYFTKEK